MKSVFLPVSILILILSVILVGLLGIDRPDEADLVNAAKSREPVGSSVRPASTPRAATSHVSSSDAFQDWTNAYLAAPLAERPALERRGVELAAARRESMLRLIQSNPERALAAMVSPATRAALPTKVVAQLEEVVMGEGFFGVLSICHLHDALEGESGSVEHRSHVKREVGIDDRFLTAHTYGSRTDQLTTENASIFGVALDGHLALHENAAVPVARSFLSPASIEEVGPGEFAAIHDGDIAVFQSATQRQEWIADQTEEVAADADGLVTAKGLVFDPGTPPTGASPPTAVYNRYSGRNSHQLGPKTVMMMVVRPSDGEAYGASVPTHASTIAGLNSSSQWYYNESYKQRGSGRRRIPSGSSTPWS